MREGGNAEFHEISVAGRRLSLWGLGRVFPHHGVLWSRGNAMGDVACSFLAWWVLPGTAMMASTGIKVSSVCVWELTRGREQERTHVVLLSMLKLECPSEGIKDKYCVPLP